MSLNVEQIIKKIIKTLKIRRNWIWEKIVFWNNFFGRGIFFLYGGAIFSNFLFVFRLNWNWEKIIFWNNLFSGGIYIFLGGGFPYLIFCTNLLFWVKLGYPPYFSFLGKPLLGEKYVEGKRKKKEEERKNNAKSSGHYVCPRTHNVCAHTLRSHQHLNLIHMASLN